MEEGKEKKKWFQDARFWVSLIAIAVSVVALWQSCSANNIAEKTNDIMLVSIKPTLVAEWFVSHSIDFLDEQDLKRIERQRVIVELPRDSEQIETNRQYAWLLIKNKGSGLAKIFSMEITYSLDGNSEIKSFEWKEARVIKTDEALAIYLGYFLGNLQFNEVKVTYRSALCETDPLHIAFAPDGISLHIRNVATITIKATPSFP